MRIEQFHENEIANLVDEQTGLVSRLLFTDETLYRLEQQRVFAKSWLYLAHETEIPCPGDFVTRTMGEDPVLVVRGSDGVVRAFLNSCPHRGTLVCRADAGSAGGFVCPYHGWSFDNRGQLTALAYEPAYYEGHLKAEELGLYPVAHLDTYRGLIFATWDPEAPPLDAYLGPSKWYLDIYFARTPGGMEVLGRPHRWIMQANWKLGAINFAADGPHATYVHGPITERLAGIPAQVIADLLATSPAFSLGNGHNGIFTLLPDEAPAWLGCRPELVELYRQCLDPHQQHYLSKMISGVQTQFPNFSWVQAPISVGENEPPVMFLAIRVWNPRGPDRTEILDWFLVEKEAPADYKEAVLRAGLRTFSVGGTFDQDDSEAWAGIARGIHGEIGRSRPMNFQATLAFRNKVIPDFPGPGRAYPSTYAEMTEFDVLVEWKRRMMGGR
jgi:phenylpropionate dioxygenase-like ring-hydroxylating dioxygenase large terminal subunit